MAYVIKPLEEAFQAHAFEINGAIALRNYTAQVDGTRIKITSTENAALSILEAEVSEVEIDGQVYTNPVDAQNALQSIIYAELPIVVLTEAEKQKLILKLPPEHPDANKILQAGGTLVDLPTPAPKQIQQIPTYNDLPVPGEEGIVYYIIDEDEDYAWSNVLNDYYDYVEAKGFLDDRARDLADDLSEMEQISIMTKLNNVWRGKNNQNVATPQNYTESVSGQNNINTGKGSLSLAGSNNKNLESAKGGVTIGGAYNENGGCLSIIFGGLLLKTKSFIEYAFGVANEEHTVYNEENWDDRDVLMHIGGGDFTGSLDDPNTPPVATQRRNLFTLFKYGIWRWKVRGTLNNTPTEILEQGMHGPDEDGRLNYYDGTEWKRYPIEGEVSTKKKFLYLNQSTDISLSAIKAIITDGDPDTDNDIFDDWHIHLNIGTNNINIDVDVDGWYNVTMRRTGTGSVNFTGANIASGSDMVIGGLNRSLALIMGETTTKRISVNIV